MCFERIDQGVKLMHRAPRSKLTYYIRITVAKLARHRPHRTPLTPPQIPSLMVLYLTKCSSYFKHRPAFKRWVVLVHRKL